MSKEAEKAEETPKTEFTLADLEADESQGEETKDEKENTEEKEPEDSEVESDKEEQESEKKESSKKSQEKKEEAKEEEDDFDEEESEEGKEEEEEEEDEPTDADDFYSEVDKLRGDTIEVDYGEVDPLSPEGVVLRERAIEDAAILRMEKTLEEKYPKAYAYLLHTMSGKPDDEFFGKKDLVELPSEEQIEMNVDLQKQVVLKNLAAKGIPEKAAKAVIDQAESDNELEEMAKAARKEIADAQQAELDALKEENERQTQLQQKALKDMADYVDAVVDAGKIGNLTIPQKDRKEFAKAFKESIKFNDGKFLLVTELTKDNVEEAFQKEYFRYKKGDLGAFITKKAKTENVRRLRRTLPNPKPPKSTAEDDATTFVPLGDID